MCPSSNLFSMLFTAMLTDAFSEEDPGIKLRYRTDGNSTCVPSSHYKGERNSAKGLLFADDCSLNNHTEVEMRTTVDKFSTACAKFDLTISNSKKTEVMYQPAPDQPHLKPFK